VDKTERKFQTMSTIRTYDELIKFKTFTERFNYLKLNGQVGDSTFGFDRYLNQRFYKSPIWKKLRNEIIVRDNGCDLAFDGREIFGKLFIHHMNPIRTNDILEQTEWLLNPDYLVCVSYETHNAIHYGTEELLKKDFAERKPNDTCLWAKN